MRKALFGLCASLALVFCAKNLHLLAATGGPMSPMVLEASTRDRDGATKRPNTTRSPSEQHQPGIVIVSWTPPANVVGAAADQAGASALCYVVTAAALTHNSLTVHLLAEDYNFASACNSFTNVHVWELSKFRNSELEVKFQSVYKNCTQNYWVKELQCFERFFWLLKFMQVNLVERVLFIDSDVVLTQNVFDRGLPVSSPFWARSPQSTFFSYWSVRALIDFCKFMINFYQGPNEEVAKRLNLRGGFRIDQPDWWPLPQLEARHFSDMFLQAAFLDERHDIRSNIWRFKLHDVRALKPNFTNFINLTWKVVNTVNVPSLDGKPIDCVHFQGRTKYLIPKFFHTVWPAEGTKIHPRSTGHRAHAVT